MILLKIWTGWGRDWSLHPLLKWEYFSIDIKLVSRAVFKNDIYLCICIMLFKRYMYTYIHVDMCISLYCRYIGISDIYIVDIMEHIHYCFIVRGYFSLILLNFLASLWLIGFATVSTHTICRKSFSSVLTLSFHWEMLVGVRVSDEHGTTTPSLPSWML